MTQPGIENLRSVEKYLSGARLGLMTNPTGVDSRLRSTIDLLYGSHCLSALFACEHGVRGDIQAGQQVDTFVDPDTGLPVFSCFGKNAHLTEEMLAAFDVFVFDMQDVGARFYTYLYSLSYAMEDCARAGKPVVVLDRPNPLGGLQVEGTLLEPRLHSFVGEYPMPTRYGLTIGEYALWVKDHLKLDLSLHIAPMIGWERRMRYQDTGLCFVPPSPNCATLHAADIYTGTCIFEGTNISEGRGTTLPFEYIGAPFVNGPALSQRMNALGLPGVLFRPAWFTPQFAKYPGELCSGVQIHLTNPRAARPFEIGLRLMEAIRSLHGDKLEWRGFEPNGSASVDRLLGTDAFRLGQMDADALLAYHAPRIAAWQAQSRAFWLYS